MLSHVQFEIKKKKKGTKGSNTYTVGFGMGNFVQKFLHNFLPNLGRLCFGGPRRKLLGPTKIPSPSPYQSNISPNNFLSFFFFFHPTYFTSNQTHP